MAEDADRLAHRRHAVIAFNRTWELIDTPDRSADQADEMLVATFASRYHWDRAGGAAERVTADWQIAHVASQLGLADLALRYADAALALAQREGFDGWRLASCYEGMARAHAAAGNRAERDRYVDLARRELAQVADAGDRGVIESQLATVPAV